MGQISFFSTWISNCPAPAVEETIHWPLNGLSILVKNHLPVDVYFWSLYSVLLVFIDSVPSVFMPVSHSFGYL